MTVDLAHTHVRSICLGRLDEPDQPGSSTGSCDSGVDPSSTQKFSHASCVSRSHAYGLLARDQERIANLNYIYNTNNVEVVYMFRMRRTSSYELVKRFRERGLL
jgi:hypothetical protein